MRAHKNTMDKRKSQSATGRDREPRKKHREAQRKKIGVKGKSESCSFYAWGTKENHESTGAAHTKPCDTHKGRDPVPEKSGQCSAVHGVRRMARNHQREAGYLEDGLATRWGGNRKEKKEKQRGHGTGGINEGTSLKQKKGSKQHHALIVGGTLWIERGGGGINEIEKLHRGGRKGKADTRRAPKKERTPQSERVKSATRKGGRGKK